MKRYMFWIRSILITLLAGWICMLHFFSAQPAEESGSLSEGFCYRIAQITVADFDTFSPAEQAEIVGKFQKPVRKTAHFCEYALGGLLVMLLLNTFSLSSRVRWAFGAGFGLLNAALDELHQGFVAGRSPEVGDVLLDVCGVLCGMAVVWAIFWWRKKHTLR